MRYNPRTDCTDVELDSDDRWYTERHLLDRIDCILREHDDTTVGIAEVPLQLRDPDKQHRVRRWESRLRHVARIQGDGVSTLYHWSVAELIAYDALFEWWGRIAVLPLGSWPWNASGVQPAISGSLDGLVPVDALPRCTEQVDASAGLVLRCGLVADHDGGHDMRINWD